MSSNGNGNGFKDGSYNCRVETVAAMEANTGSPYLLFGLVVTEGEFEGETINYEAYATDGRKAYFKKELAALGFDTENGNWDDLPTVVMGKPCNVTLKTKEWHKKLTQKAENLKAVSAVNLPGGIMGRIAALFGGKITKAEGPGHPDVPF